MTSPERDGRRGRPVRAAALFTLLLLGWKAPAQPAETAAGDALAMERLASQIAQEIASARAEPPVAILVRAGTTDLARVFTTLLAARLARRKLAPVALEAPPSSAGETEARAAGARSLVRLTVSLDDGQLHARGDVLGTWVNFWSGATPSRPSFPAAVLDASGEVDAHALALASAAPSPGPAGAIGELRLMGAVFARLPRWTAALAAGDLDGDGRDEVVALTDEEILAFSPEGRIRATRDLRALPHSPSPSREPFGALAVDTSARLVSYLSAQRSRGDVLALDPSGGGFRVVRALERAPLGQFGGAELTGEMVAGQNTFRPALVSSTAVSPFLAPAAFHSLSAFVGPSGVELLFVHPSGTATWRRGFAPDAASLELRGLGAASALADVDGDGTAEIATTEPTWAPSPEVLRVLRAPSTVGSAAAEGGWRFRKELPRGRAIQIVAADLDGDRAQELVVGLWLPDGTAELQVFGRAP